MLKRGFQFAPGYRLQEFLGRGQFGQVWRATAPGGAATAAKFIDLSDGQGQKEYDGVRRVKQIRHANLMPITAIWLLDGEGKVIEEAPDEAIETIDLSVTEQGGSGIHSRDVEPSWLVVAMLLGGKSLQARLRECVEEGLPGIPPKELISYMDEAAKGIDFLNAPQHDLGEGPISIQHSDIKPANIVLIGSSAVVCDFGLARILTRNQVTATSAAGTPAYMAPEAISGKPCRTSDQYALAVTYYHLRTGTLPVNDGSLWEVLDAHRQGNLKFNMVPESEQEVLRKATELDWENRFDSCVEMVDSLREALRAEGYTKPGFVPTSLRMEADGGQAGATATQGDPTATLDLPTGEVSTDQAMEATAPFVAGEQSTKKEGFKKETLPALDENAIAPTQADSIWNVLGRNRNLAVAIGVGAMALMLAVIVFPRDNSERMVASTEDDPKSDPIDVDPVPPEVEADFATLHAQARSLVDSDPMAAAIAFGKALDAEPNWQPQPMVLLKGHRGAVMMMAQTDDGEQLVSAADGATPFLWNLQSLTDPPIQLVGHETLLEDLVLLPGKKRLLTAGSDSVARVWDLAARDPAKSGLELAGHVNRIDAVAWRGDQLTAATASSDLNLGIWQIGPPTQDNPNGSLVSDRRISIGQSLRSLASDDGGVHLAALSVGSDPVSPEPDVLLYRWDDLLTIQGVPNAANADTRTAKRVAMLSKRPYVVTGDYGGGVRLYGLVGNKLEVKTQIREHQGDVDALKVVTVDDTDVIVSGGADGSVCRWRYDDTQDVQSRTFSTLGVSSVDVAEDGRFVAAGMIDGTLWLWDSSVDDKAAGAFRVSLGASVDSVQINTPQQLLIGGCEDGVIRVWDLRDLKLMLMTVPTPPASAVETEIKIDSTPLS